MRKWRTALLMVLVVCVVSIGFTECKAESAVKIYRDNYGVPHIYANSLEGLYYGWGYAAAQDRFI